MQLNFMKFKWLYFLISAIFIVPGIFSLIKWGLKPAIDFTGGSIIEIKNPAFSEVSSDAKALADKSAGKAKISEVINKVENVKLSSIQEADNNTYILKLNNIDKNQKEQILKNLETDFGQSEELQFQTVGPAIGKELIKKTATAILLAAGFILFYIAQRFANAKYGICAILAMFHDTFIMLGIFSLLGHFLGAEVDTLFVTALLTILSFSVHDTVVVYDRIRESVRLYPKARLEDLVNKAVAETLTRSVNNSMTIILMLTSLYLLGGESIKWFSFALLIGTISGTYSSTFTAAPLLVLWDQWQNRKK